MAHATDRNISPLKELLISGNIEGLLWLSANYIANKLDSIWQTHNRSFCRFLALTGLSRKMAGEFHQIHKRAGCIVYICMTCVRQRMRIIIRVYSCDNYGVCIILYPF